MSRRKKPVIEKVEMHLSRGNELDLVSKTGEITANLFICYLHPYDDRFPTRSYKIRTDGTTITLQPPDIMTVEYLREYLEIMDIHEKAIKRELKKMKTQIHRIVRSWNKACSKEHVLMNDQHLSLVEEAQKEADQRKIAG